MSAKPKPTGEKKSRAVAKSAQPASGVPSGSAPLLADLREKRAEYGEQIVATLSRQLVTEFGRGFEERSLRRIRPCAQNFPHEHIASAPRRQLTWRNPRCRREDA